MGLRQALATKMSFGQCVNGVGQSQLLTACQDKYRRKCNRKKTACVGRPIINALWQC